MWVAKFDLTHNCVLANKTTKYGVSSKNITLSRFTENGEDTFVFLSKMYGKARDINKVLAALKKDKTVKDFEYNVNTCVIKSTSQTMLSRYYDNRIFFVTPNMIAEDGHENWCVGSWDKEVLSTFVHNARRISDEFELKQLANQSVDSLFLERIGPKLTPQQKHVFDIAVENGYFSWPRKTNIRRMAENANLSVSAFHEHLRKAEARLIEAITQK